MISFIFSLRFLAGLVAGGAAVWFFKAQISTWAVWTAGYVKARLARK